MTLREEFRALLPVLGVTLLFPVPLLNFLADGTGRGFAFIYLFFGCALMAGECFRPGPDGAGRWAVKTAALVIATAVAVASFCVCYWVIGGSLGISVVGLAVLVVVPAVCLVPYFTMLDGRPYVAVAFAAVLLGGVKLAGCAVVRVVYGPTALADGRMAMSWQEPNVLVWFCVVGSLLASGVAVVLGSRRVGVRPAA